MAVILSGACGESMEALHPVQVAYHVPDVAFAAERYAEKFGWGPFFLLEHIELSRSLHRGRPAPFDHTSAYGQAGRMMVELIMQHDDSPSALRDMFAASERGMHHVACFVENLPEALAHYRMQGFEVALDARTATGGVDFAIVDTSAALGHMLELYEQREPLRRFYSYVRRAAENWNGSNPVRRL
jgi:hypothetical protein